MESKVVGKIPWTSSIQTRSSEKKISESTIKNSAPQEPSIFSKTKSTSSKQEYKKKLKEDLSQLGYEDDKEA